MPDGLKKIEEKYGLPSLQGIVNLLSGEQASVLRDILTRAEKLSKQEQMLKDAITLIGLIGEIDRKGTLTRLNETLKLIEPMVKDKTLINKLLNRFDKMEKLLTELAKPSSEVE